jgi:transcriptional regulator with GAF, ATPase, and Fis domain
MNPRLSGIAGPFQGVAFALPEGEVSIGREPSNQLSVFDPVLSRRHCLLIGKSGQVTLRDLGSQNGTYVNGMPVVEQELHHGDQICVGNSLLLFLLEGDESRPATSPIVFTETVQDVDSRFLLPSEDDLYIRLDKVIGGLPQASRLVRDLNTLMKIAKGIGSIHNVESLQWQLLGLIFDVVPAERGAVLLFDDPEDLSAAVAWDRVLGAGQPVEVSQTIVRQVARDRRGLVVSDVSVNKAIREIRTVSELGVCSLLCVPLVESGKVAGAIYLDTRKPAERFDENHLQVMTAVAGMASLALENARRWEHLEQENQDLRAEINLEHNMVGSGSRMRAVFEFIRRVAPTDSTVLILGESGTGKELVARALHRNSPRANRPYVAINCAAITETLLESELFGHERGAFTGANIQKKGKMEVAEGGTVFLDEVGELAPSLQAKLLRVLQEREFERVGGTRSIKLDIRVIAATNAQLPEKVKAGTFRSDLFYRLNVVALTMPALRERREDIPQLADYFITKASQKCNTRVRPLSVEARALLNSYDWPGNVRELENAIERALVLGSTSTILPEDLPEAILEAGLPVSTGATTYHLAIKNLKRQLILQALQQAHGSYIQAANVLGLHPNSLLRLIRTLDLKGAIPPQEGE